MQTCQLKSLPILLPILFLSACGGSSSSEPQSAPTGPLTPPASSPVDDPVTPPVITPPINESEGLFGPLGGSGIDGEYSQFNDSPFANMDFTGGYFYFEDFEDQVLEYPGIQASHGNFVSIEFGEFFHDSVDADDGLIDTDSLNGESWFYDVANTGIQWTFDAAALNQQLPTHVGLVWTDGRGVVIFEAFDAQGQSLGTVSGQHANGSFNGETDEDRFYGVIHFDGISAVKIRSMDRLNGIEMDHLQWGYRPGG